MGYMQSRQLYEDYNSYLYWVEDILTPEDRLDLELPAVADFYSGLANFIRSRIDLIGLPGYEHSQQKATVLKESLNNYFSGISKKEESFRDLINKGTLPSLNNFKKSLIFNGLNIEVGGELHDLSQGYVWAGDLISNIDTSPAFIRYATEYMANQFVNYAHSKLPIHYRIYLNPRICKTLEVAGQLSDEFEKENLQVMSKIIDRSYEVSRKQGRMLGVRSEGITIYCNKYHANRTLEIILECFERNYDAFQDRPSPKLATPIAPGIAVASEEGFDTVKYSFNSHRSSIIESAWVDFNLQQAANSASTVAHQGLYTFKQMLHDEFRRNEINPRNISFNDPSASYDIL